MRSMDDMMNMSFDELRSSIAPAGPTQTRALRMPTPEVPDHAQELDVYLAGPGADEACGRGSGAHGAVRALDPDRADAACLGKRDFILFENLDQAPTARRGATPRLTPRRARRRPALASASSSSPSADPAHRTVPRRISQQVWRAG